ncbi:MAG: c-type cytochrome domain-containing protein, partial [Planctomycetota bacterium]
DSSSLSSSSALSSISTWRRILLCAFVLAGVIAPRGGFADEPSFLSDVAPILIDKCLACHGPEKSSGRYRLDTFERLLTSGRSKRPPIVAGNARDSLIYSLLVHKRTSRRMPKKSDPLPANEISIVERWIVSGAHFDGDRKAALHTLAPTHYPRAPEPYPAPVPVTALAFSPLGDEIAASGYREVTVWSTNDASFRRRIPKLEQRTFALAYHPSEAILAIAGGTPGRRGEVTLVNPQTGEILRRLAISTDAHLDLAFSPDGSQLAIAAADGSVRVAPTQGVRVRTIKAHADWVLALAWNDDGTRLATASRDKTAKVFDVKLGRLDRTYSGHGDVVSGVAFLPNGDIWSAGRDRKLHRWNSNDGKRRQTLGGANGEIYRVVVAGDSLFSSCADGVAREHASEGTSKRRSYGSGEQEAVLSLSVHAASSRLATGSFDGTVRIYTTKGDGKELTFFVASPPPRAVRRF